MTAPVRTGHLVELNFPRTMALAKQKGQFARIKIAKIVRIDRSHITEDAHIGHCGSVYISMAPDINAGALRACLCRLLNIVLARN